MGGVVGQDIDDPHHIEFMIQLTPVIGVVENDGLALLPGLGRGDSHCPPCVVFISTRVARIDDVVVALPVEVLDVFIVGGSEGLRGFSGGNEILQGYAHFAPTQSRQECEVMTIRR